MVGRNGKEYVSRNLLCIRNDGWSGEARVDALPGRSGRHYNNWRHDKGFPMPIVEFGYGLFFCSSEKMC